MNIFLVGGAVRDQIMGLTPKDKDYVVVGATHEQMIQDGFEQVGADFPVYLHPETKEEFALARTERKNGKGYNGFTTLSTPDVTLEEDLLRRDLTINSIAMDKIGNLYDPYHGVDDIHNKVLRHTSEAFSEDPLRILRIARFKARFGNEWTVHKDTSKLIQAMIQNGDLKDLTPERVWKETERALMEKHPSLYFEFLNQSGLFEVLDAMESTPQPANHHPEGNVFIHTMLVLQRSADLGFDLETRFAALCHDFGKAYTYQTTGKLHGHEQDGVSIIDDFCDQWKIPNKLREIAKLTSDHHTRSHKAFDMTGKKVFSLLFDKLASDKNPKRFVQFLNACQCDAQGRGPTKVNEPYPQADYLLKLHDKIVSVDKKALSKESLMRGHKGKDIGEFIRSMIYKEFLNEVKKIKPNKPDSAYTVSL